MQDYPLFSVIVLNYNGKSVLRPCLESLLKTDYPNFEIILVDNHSTDGSVEEVEKLFGNIINLKIVKNPVPLFYAGGNNVGFAHSRGKYLALINNDVEVNPGWLKELENKFRINKDVGAVQPKILYYYSPEVIDNVGQDMDIFGFGLGSGHNQRDLEQFDKRDEVFFASGVAMAVRRDLINRIGLFDDKFIFYYEDNDLSWRIRLYGYKISFCPKARVFHKVSQTTRVFSEVEELAFHARKNRIAILIRNYSLPVLLVIMPFTLMIYVLMYFKEALIDHNRNLANTLILALKWNIKNMDYNLSKRRFVQEKIRKVSDWRIMKKMNKFPLLLKYMLMSQ